MIKDILPFLFTLSLAIRTQNHICRTCPRQQLCEPCFGRSVPDCGLPYEGKNYRQLL